MPEKLLCFGKLPEQIYLASEKIHLPGQPDLPCWSRSRKLQRNLWMNWRLWLS